MKKLVINGGKPLKGEVTISGAKNSTVALIPAAIIANEPVVLEGVPEIQDVDALIEIFPNAKRENSKHACFVLLYGSNSC